MDWTDSGVVDIEGVAVFIGLPDRERPPRGGVCDTVGGELWFSLSPDDMASAIAICHTCPIEKQCREYAERSNEKWGIWGGVDMGLNRTCVNGNTGYHYRDYSQNDKGNLVCGCPLCERGLSQ